MHENAVDRMAQIRDGRCHQQRFLGDDVDARAQVRAGVGDRVQLGRVGAIGHHRRRVRMLGGQLGQAQLDDLSDFRRSAVAGAHRQQHRRSEVGRDTGRSCSARWA